MENDTKRNSGGRPVKPESLKKSKSITTWLTKDEYDSVLEKFKSSPKSISNKTRDILLKGEVKSAFSEDEKKLLYTFVGLANNVNQLAFQANLGGVKSIEKELFELVPILREKVKDLKK